MLDMLPRFAQRRVDRLLPGGERPVPPVVDETRPAAALAVLQNLHVASWTRTRLVGSSS